MDNNQNDLKFKKNPKFKKGDIFYINRKGDKKYGTVKLAPSKKLEWKEISGNEPVQIAIIKV